MKHSEPSVVIKRQSLLTRKINELPLKMETTHLGELILQCYDEMEKAGIHIKPRTYLSTDWGCPNKVPVIGIPFYLADPILCRLQTKMTGRVVENDKTIMMFLRHEVGHAFNYAYRLYDQQEWQKLFGCFSLPYKDKYNADPTSKSFVHHLRGYYAQKHPDDDFAETFAVRITPDLDWRKAYTGTPAMKKLLYINKVLAKYGAKSPKVTDGKLHMPLKEIEMTLGEWYKELYKKRSRRTVLNKLYNSRP